MLFYKNAKLVMIGDSITDCGRTRPVAEGLFDPLGRGYVSMVEAIMGACHPGLGVRVVNMGNGGNTVRELKARWNSDVLDLKPDWVSLMIGINDVWRQFDLPRQKETHVMLDEYEQTLEGLISSTMPKVKGMVLFTPYYIESNLHDAMRATMDKYSQVVRDLAKKHKAVLVDTQAAFDKALKHYYPGTLAWDRVHPNQTGHMLIAKAFCKAVQVNW